ncbi:MAG: hypothetical protein IMZ44_19850 [Planctomycetes bacterium]|nr:hypothetical protein [Planctomycetota bacterium]
MSKLCITTEAFRPWVFRHAAAVGMTAVIGLVGPIVVFLLAVVVSSLVGRHASQANCGPLFGPCCCVVFGGLFGGMFGLLVCLPVCAAVEALVGNRVSVWIQLWGPAGVLVVMIFAAVAAFCVRVATMRDDDVVFSTGGSLAAFLAAYLAILFITYWVTLVAVRVLAARCSVSGLQGEAGQ